jgi:hypothetical protein
MDGAGRPCGFGLFRSQEFFRPGFETLAAAAGAEQVARCLAVAASTRMPQTGSIAVAAAPACDESGAWLPWARS